MKIRRLNATFGCLQQRQLELKDGLNIIHAPNESGKSTWCAFLHVMFYGFEKGRGATSEKNRYQPWSGQSMQGVMEVDDITVSRSTARVNSPMGKFSATYTGTDNPVPGLDAANCGETLLGIGPEVFDHSLFVRQAQLGIGQSAELEKRISALITTGEEDSSYKEIQEALKKQLNRRQVNRSTGQLPQIRQEIDALEQSLEELQAMEQSLESLRRERKVLESQQLQAEAQLRQHQDADRYQHFETLEQAERSYRDAATQLQALENVTCSLPSPEQLAALRGALQALEGAEEKVRSAREKRQKADLALQSTREKQQSHPFAGMSPEEAQQLPLEEAPRPKLGTWVPILAPLLGIALTALLRLANCNWLLTVGAGIAAMGLIWLLPMLSLQKKQKAWDENHRQLLQQRESQLQEYAALYHTAEEALSLQQQAQAACLALEESFAADRSSLLQQVQRFSPGVTEPAAVSYALEESRRLHQQVAAARQKAQEAKLRFELLPPVQGERPPATERPTQSREALEQQRQQILQRLQQLAAQAHHLEGRSQAIGERGALESELELKRQQKCQLQNEYDAIIMAMDELEKANITLQNRFSPALGQEAGRIFAAMTGGRYDRVLLSREFVASAQETDDPMRREAAFLSQGTADQLYLAVRLAICHLVLPQDKNLPIILDDAFANFDDARLHSTLDWLLEEAKDRQILLFTCHKREGDYLQGRENVHHICV